MPQAPHASGTLPTAWAAIPSRLSGVCRLETIPPLPKKRPCSRPVKRTPTPAPAPAPALAPRFDDVVRVAAPAPETKKTTLELDDKKSSKGLGELYEEDYQRAVTGVSEDKVRGLTWDCL
jgi:hypothetical protein